MVENILPEGEIQKEDDMTKLLDAGVKKGDTLVQSGISKVKIFWERQHQR